jgi:4-diphosphocytidyl-2-C-methyl-D-erythritol kinase
VAFSVSAPAKVNLTLEVLGRRPDGYHEIRSVMQAVSLADRLEFEPASDGLIRLSGGSSDAPPDESNLVLRAARALAEASGATSGAWIHLEKRIPAGAGLGGGSSDAAATLLALNGLWGLDMPLPDLMDIAARLGSDVPFFLSQGTALAEGRGERLTFLPAAPVLWLTLVKPAASLPTPEVYAGFARTGPGAHDDVTPSLLGALVAGSVEGVARNLRNDLQPAAVALCPEIDDVLSLMRESGAVAAQVSGSGSACFALCHNRERAEAVAAAAARRGWWAAVARTTRLPMEVR